MSWTIERMQCRILNREAKKHPPPLHSHPKYTIPFSISRRFESPLKIHWKTLFESLHSDFWRITTVSRIMEYSNALKLHSIAYRVIPVTEDENRFETCLRHRQTLAILATHVEDSRYIAEKAAGNVARRLSRVQDSFMRGNMYPVCHVALVSKSWWWARRVTLSLLSFPPEKSVPVDTLFTRYSKKYNAWMDLSWKKNEIKYGIMVRVMRIFLHIHISFGHEFIWTIDFGKIKLIKKWSLKIILLLWYTLVRGSRQVLKFLIWIDITMA